MIACRDHYCSLVSPSNFREIKMGGSEREDGKEQGEEGYAEGKDQYARKFHAVVAMDFYERRQVG